jgi:hypothetical protein
MHPQEFYIRRASEPEASGPYNLDQLIFMVGSGAVTVETLFYDATTEQWIAVGDNAELRALIFPEKKKLTVKAKARRSPLRPKESDSLAPITVEDMLAAAEARTSETAGKQNADIAASRAAAVGMWALIVMFFVSAAGSLYPAVDVLLAFEPAKLLAHPLAILGVIDLMFALLLWLGMSSLYPYVRFRAASGIGFFGLIFFLQGDHGPFVAAIAGSVGLYLCTVFASFLPVAIAAAVGLAGMGFVAYHFILL